MSQAKSRRGRPKGTGIDDSDRIARLTELIKVRPDLKPTTAIRVMGISDPSVIRRLRDKYTAQLRLVAAEAPQLRTSTSPAARAANGPADPAAIVRH